MELGTQLATTKSQSLQKTGYSVTDLQLVHLAMDSRKESGISVTGSAEMLNNATVSETLESSDQDDKRLDTLGHSSVVDSQIIVEKVSSEYSSVDLGCDPISTGLLLTTSGKGVSEPSSAAESQARLLLSLDPEKPFSQDGIVLNAALLQPQSAYQCFLLSGPNGVLEIAGTPVPNPDGQLSAGNLLRETNSSSPPSLELGTPSLNLALQTVPQVVPTPKHVVEKDAQIDDSQIGAEQSAEEGELMTICDPIGLHTCVYAIHIYITFIYIYYLYMIYLLSRRHDNVAAVVLLCDMHRDMLVYSTKVNNLHNKVKILYMSLCLVISKYVVTSALVLQLHFLA